MSNDTPFSKAVEFAHHIHMNGVRNIPDFYLRIHADDFILLYDYKGKSDVIDDVLVQLETAFLFPVRTKEYRRQVTRNYGKVFVALGRRDGFECVNCGTPSKDLQIDHKRPLARGGTNDLDNLQLLCRKCNLTKSDRYDDTNDLVGVPLCGQ